jgi:hypothetical protein
MLYIVKKRKEKKKRATLEPPPSPINSDVDSKKLAKSIETHLM